MKTSRPVVGGVLCAGFGTRLRPLTEALPKPLIPFLNTPIVTYALDHLARAGVERVGINLHHLPDTIPPVVDRIAAQFGLRPSYSREWEILGTAGGIRGIWKALGEPDATLVVLNGDSVMNVDLPAQIAAHRRAHAQATIVVRPKDPDQPGRVWVDADGKVRGLRDMRHPEASDQLTEYDFTGVHILEPAFLEQIPMEQGCMVGDVYGPLLEAGQDVNATVNDDFWAALDNPRLFLETTRRCLENPALFDQAPLPEPLSDGMFIYRPAAADDRAQVAKPVLLGAHTVVKAGARVGPNAVVDGTELDPHAEVRNAVVYGMGTIDGQWRDCLAVAGKVVQVE